MREESNDRNTPADRPLPSTVGDDPDMVELVEFFVGELGRTMCSLLEAFEERNLNDLRRMCHQLKGAAGGYGFPTISAAAAEAEAEAEVAALSNECDLNNLRERVESLINLCRRAAA